MSMPFCVRIPLLVLFVSLVAGCGNSKFEKMPDMELAAKNTECLTMNEPAPAMIFACENYAKECKRRREEEKRYVC